MRSRSYTVHSEIVPYPGMAGWHFVPIPKAQSLDISAAHGSRARGWGSLPVSATIGATRWDTSIFPDKKSGCYLLPLKMQVRNREGLHAGEMVKVVLAMR